MTPPNLNVGQQNAFDKYIHFLCSNDAFFAITGPAGVGKTYLMNAFSDYGLQIYADTCAMLGMKPKFDKASFCATTNKAADVLAQSIGKPVQTVHSFCGLKVQENWKTGKSDITKTKNWAPREKQILFIDETSMVDQVLFDFILETMPDSKIVFVGDHAQMAPVNEELSPVYKNVKPENYAVLDEPVRNAETPALMALCDQLRDTVETGVFRPIQAVSGVIRYLTDDTMPKMLEEVFVDPNPSSRVLCYTNNQVEAFNDYIRADVRNLPPEIQKGDVMVVAKAYQVGKTSLPVETEVMVGDISEIYYDDSFSDLIEGHSMPYCLLELRTTDGTGIRAENVRISLRKDWLAYALKTLASKREWRRFFDIKNAYLDIRHKAACTVYKAQGSTYDNVFIDLGNIGSSFDAKQVARMIYVAVSRARSQVFLYGHLPPRYNNSHGEPLWTISSGPASSSKPFGRKTSVA